MDLCVLGRIPQPNVNSPGGQSAARRLPAHTWLLDAPFKCTVCLPGEDVVTEHFCRFEQCKATFYC